MYVIQHVNSKEEKNMNIYVGNLASDVTEDELREQFTAFGGVTSVSIIKDKYSGQSRGFGFVEMPAKAEGDAAIAGLKGKTLKDRTLDVNEARPRTDSRGGGSGGGRGGGFGGGGRGGGGGRQRRY
jgi:RNA recognition motif-containing protein